MHFQKGPGNLSASMHLELVEGLLKKETFKKIAKIWSLINKVCCVDASLQI